MNLRARQFVGLLFFILFASYWYGITCFPHSHVENGVVIVHSHPFDDEHHTHTDVQYETIFYLTHFFSLECSTFHFDGLVRFALLLIPFFIWHCPTVHLEQQSRLFLRAPPQF